MKNSNHQIQLTLLAILSVCFLGCDVSVNLNGSATGIKGSGVSKTETRDIEDFEKIHFNGAGTVNLTFGESSSLEVSGDDNLLPLIETKVENGKLVISPTESINPKSKLVFNVVVVDLKEVTVAGAASMDIEEAASDSLKIQVSGAAEVTGSGAVDQLDISISGAGSIGLKEMKSKDLKISVSGAASATVYASESLDAKLSGVGSISCHGNPENVEKSTSGLGTISILD